MADDEELARKRSELLRDQYLEIDRAYGLWFGSPSGRVVLEDLIDFCKGVDTCIVDGDIHATLVNEGRRQVLLRIMRLGKLDAEKVLEFSAWRALLKGGGR